MLKDQIQIGTDLYVKPEFIHNAVSPFTLLFKSRTADSEIELFDILEALCLCEEIVQECLSDMAILENEEQVKHISDICANAIMFHFQLDDDQVSNIEARTILHTLKTLLEGFIGTAGMVTRPTLWSYVRDAVEEEYCVTDSYVDELDIAISRRALEKQIPSSLTAFCILNKPD